MRISPFVPQTLPIRISIYIYDRHIRVIFPQLPSIRNLLLDARSTVLTIFTAPEPGITPPSRRPPGRRDRNAPPVAQLPTLNVDLNSLIANGS